MAEHSRRSSVRMQPLTELSMEEADQSREVKALLSWANNLLRKRDMSAPSLGSFSDGLTLVHLVEVAFNGKLASFNSTPRTVFHKLGNITATLEFLKTHGVSFVSVDSDMIVQAKVKPLTIVLWSILRQLTLAGLKAIGPKGGASATGGAGGASSGNSIKGSLLSWCNGIVSATRAQPVEDFSGSFKDGSIFCSIISKLVPDANMSASGSGDAGEALALAFKVAEERLGVPALLTAEDFTDPDSAPDEQSVIDYMCLLLSASQRLKEAEAAAAALAAATSNSKEMEAELKQQQAELSATLANATAELTAAQSIAAAAEHRLQVAESETQRLTAELAHARKNEAHLVAEHEAQLKALQAQLQAVELKLADEHRHFVAHEAEMHATIASLNDTLVQATAQSGNTHDALEAGEQRIAALTAELEVARQAAAQAAFEAKNRLQATIDEGAQREAALNATVAELHASLGQAAGEYATTQADAEATAATLAATAAELAKQKQELADVIRVHTARGNNEIAQAAAAANAPSLIRRASALASSGPPPPAARMATLGLARTSITSLTRIANRERMTLKAFMDSFPTRVGVLNKKRPDSFFSKDAQTRYFELVGNKLMYYKDQSKVEFKGDISLDAFHPIDIERASMLAAENMSDFSIILEPIDKSQNKPAEFVPTELTAAGVADVLEWAATINTRILLTRYLEGAFKEDGFFRGVHEIVDFMADDKMTDFTMVDRAATTELHDALTTFLPSLIARQDLSLTLVNVGVGHPTVLLLNQVLTRSTTFRSLNLAHNNLQSDSAIVIAKSFARNSSLTSLDLDGNAIGDDGVAALAASLASQPMLKRLSLRANFIGDAGAVALVDGLRASAARQQRAHEFPVVELSGNRVGDRGAAALATLIAENATVTELNLRGNLLSDAGVAPLAGAMRAAAGGGGARIARLDLSSNNLSSASLQLIADMLRATQHAISINVSENLIGRVGVEALGAVDQPLEFRQLHVLRK